MKNIVLFLTHLLVCGACFAQKIGKISGKVTDEKANSIALATVKLTASEDKSKIFGTQSDEKGTFNFTNIPTGKYVFTVKMIGYADFQKELVINDTTSTLPIVQLVAQSKQLNEVVVEAKKPFVEMKMDRTVLNVENSIVASGSSALEVLEKAPGVVVDKQNDQIKLNNKTGITFMIDGRTSYLSASDITTMLSNMNSDQVATIELITNPSSKYDASGNAGIINIKLKKNKALGTNGNASVQWGNALMANMPANAYRQGINLMLNNRTAKWNVYGNGAFAGKGNANTIVVNRNTFNSGLTSNFNQNFERSNRGTGYQGKLGADYFASEKTVIGIMADVNYMDGTLDNYSFTNVLENQGTSRTTNTATQQTNAKSPASNVTLNFNVKHDFNKDGKNITFDLDYAGFASENQESFDANFFNAQAQNYDNTFLRNLTDRNIDIFAARSDFTYPMTKTLKVEIGLKSSYVITANNFLAERLLNNVWQNDVGRTNNFNYKENINAVYANLAQEWGKWGVQLGLRAEQTNANGKLVTTGEVFDRKYLSLFPTAYLMRKFNKDYSMRMGYSRRIDRPNYQQLNPFLFYMDPYAFEQGNPYLKPQFTNVYEINFSLKDYGLSLNYTDSRDLITQLSQQNDVTRTINVIRINMGRAQYATFNFFAPVKFVKWWNSQNNISFSYNKFEDNNIEGAVYNAHQFSYNFNTTHSLVFNKTFGLEVNYWLNSPRISGVEQTTIVQHALNIGLQKSLMDKKMKIKFGVDDVFLTNRWEGKLQYQNLDMTVKNRYTSRRAVLSLNYNFGNQNVKSSRRRDTATDDIKNRAN